MQMMLSFSVSLAVCACEILGQSVTLSSLFSYAFISPPHPPLFFSKGLFHVLRTIAQPFLVTCETVQKQNATLTVSGYFTLLKSSSGSVRITLSGMI